jgi:hypothetical protein
MESMRFTTLAYLFVFTILSLSGAFIAYAVQAMALSQYLCNFVYGAIITIYALENWCLLVDLNKRNEIVLNDKGHITIIKELTATNHILVCQNNELKRKLEKSKPVKIIEKPVHCIISWHNKWNIHCSTNNFTPPPIMTAPTTRLFQHVSPQTGPQKNKAKVPPLKPIPTL